MSKKIIITVDATGAVTVQTRGYIGGECKSASKPFEDALGLKITEVLTPEYHQTAKPTTQIKTTN